MPTLQFKARGSEKSRIKKIKKKKNKKKKKKKQKNNECVGNLKYV
jgi:CelD/BcsL family acetyltransferase involved in cellulose biosynthesis